MNNEELLKKWRSILNYDSHGITPLTNEWKRLYCAILMDEAEKQFPIDLLRYVIPTIRKNEGPLRTTTIDGKCYHIIELLNGDEHLVYAVSFDDVKIDVDNNHIHPLHNCYKMVNREWEWV